MKSIGRWVPPPLPLTRLPEVLVNVTIANSYDGGGRSGREARGDEIGFSKTKHPVGVTDVSPPWMCVTGLVTIKSIKSIKRETAS